MEISQDLEIYDANEKNTDLIKISQNIFENTQKK